MRSTTSMPGSSSLSSNAVTSMTRAAPSAHSLGDESPSDGGDATALHWKYCMSLGGRGGAPGASLLSAFGGVPIGRCYRVGERENASGIQTLNTVQGTLIMLQAYKP